MVMDKFGSSWNRTDSIGSVINLDNSLTFSSPRDVANAYSRYIASPASASPKQRFSGGEIAQVLRLCYRVW